MSVVVLFFVMFFFFQAEDGIRDLVRSRGLGDVYKRQVWNVDAGHVGAHPFAGLGGADRPHADQDEHLLEPVSYTHLTLPTSDLV